jgi:CubicO group peptidase (beta-lactamase class C family)
MKIMTDDQLSLEVDEAHRGFDARGLARVGTVLERGVQQGVYPGAVAAIAQSGRLVYLQSVGVIKQPDEADRPMPTDAIFDLASVTKPVAGATALLLAIEDGLLTLDDPVADYVPEFRGPRKAGVTLRHLVTHTSGITSYPKLYHEHTEWKSLFEEYCVMPLSNAPGATYEYASENFFLLALAIERVSGRKLDDMLAERVFGPLGLRDTMFTPDVALLPRIPATEYVRWRNRYDWGIVNDKTAQLMGGVSAHAGLFSTARDLATFGDALLADGRDGRHRMLSRDAARLLLSRVPSGGERALGICWWPGRTGVFGDLLGAQCFGHTGTSGTAMCVVPEAELSIVLLTNRVNPTRSNHLINAFRPRFFNSVAAAVVGQ